MAINKKTEWSLLNGKLSDTAYIMYNPQTGLFTTTYIPGANYLTANGNKASYQDSFKTIRGAKSSMTRYLGYKTRWEQSE